MMGISIQGLINTMAKNYAFNGEKYDTED